MPRTARIVIPDMPHHITQRGNNRAPVFFQDADYVRYLALLAEQTLRYHVRVHGYSLMTNHVHLALTPPNEQALARAVGRTHYQYTQYINATYGRSGHLWQNRFSSCALDDEHFWTALLYIERNAERAHLVESAAEYRWSSAPAHLSGDDPTGLLDLITWRNDMSAEAWRERLQIPDDETLLRQLRLSTHIGRPLGSEAFLVEQEVRLGRRLLPLPVGRPRNKVPGNENR